MRRDDINPLIPAGFDIAWSLVTVGFGALLVVAVLGALVWFARGRVARRDRGVN